MYNNKHISVVVPCFNEESQIESVIDGIPDYIDKIVIVDDKSKDNTIEVVNDLKSNDERVILIFHNKNQGVGAAIASGYKWSRDNNIDIAVVMAGDNQMDPQRTVLLH